MDSVQPGHGGGCARAGRRPAISFTQNLQYHFWEDSGALEHMLWREPGMSVADLSLEPKIEVFVLSKQTSQGHGRWLSKLKITFNN